MCKKTNVRLHCCDTLKALFHHLVIIFMFSTPYELIAFSVHHYIGCTVNNFWVLSVYHRTEGFSVFHYSLFW